MIDATVKTDLAMIKGAVMASLIGDYEVIERVLKAVERLEALTVDMEYR